MSNTNPNEDNVFQCPICLDEKDIIQNLIVVLHDYHKVFSQCNKSLRSHNIIECPLCRHPINDDIRNQIHTMNTHQRIVSDFQLRSFGISQEFINLLHVQNRIPFYYTGRFEGTDFVRQVQEEYSAFIEV